MSFWIVKGKSNRNDWTDMLVPGRSSTWETKRPPADWAEGDRLFIWEGAPGSRLVGLATLERVLGREGDGYCSFKIRARSIVLVNSVHQDELRRHPLFVDAAFLKAGPAATVYRLPDALAAHLIQTLHRRSPELHPILAEWSIALPDEMETKPAVNGALSESCVYAIVHGDRLRGAAATHGPSTYIEEGRQWVGAYKLLADAQLEGRRLVVLFADARDCSELIGWALLTDIQLEGNTTTRYQFENLQALNGHTPQELILLNSGKAIAPGFIRSYALCQRPAFLEPNLAIR